MLSHTWATRPAPRRLPPAARPAAASAILELQRLAGNRAVTGALASVQRDDDDNPYADDAAKAPPRHVTGYLGLNPKAGKEAEGLRKASKEDVLVSLNNPEAEKRFRESPAVFDFVESELGIDITDFARWDKATDVLLKADPHLREQLADLMRWFNSAERGDITLARLVLSGHSNGVELWGEAEADAESKPGTMVIERDLATLTAVFPKATAEVEDVMFSACFSINAVELVVKMFPNLRSCWSYSAFSPNVAGGSAGHIAAWSRATEGGKTPGKGDKRGTSALWTKDKGFIVGDPSAAAVGPLYSAAVRAWREVAEPMYRGERDVAKAALDPVYRKLQELLAHPGASDDMRKSAANARDIVLRLRFWPLVRERFGKEYETQLKPAYDALGMTLPVWASLTRAGLKAHIEAVDKAIEAHPDQAAAKEVMQRLLKKGLFGLDKEIVKADWI